MTTPNPEAIAETLAYYNCRRVNSKADDPIFGYHTFSEDQRDFLRQEQSEAAAEIHRMLTSATAQAKAEALREAADAVPGPSEYLMDSATCRMIAHDLRARAATIEGKDS